MKNLRLNDNEVKTVAEMQRKIDSYEQFIDTLNVMIKCKNTNLTYLITIDREKIKAMNNICRWVKERIIQEQ